MDNRVKIPLKKRPIDIILLIFFFINILFVSYNISLEQIVIEDPYNFDYPIWPPSFIIDAVHWWGDNFDPALMARPPWWRATIWLDALLFGPFYLLAIITFIKGKEWIRIPSIIYGSIIITNVTIILFEEFLGPYQSPNIPLVVLANASWIIFPLILIIRMWVKPHPFTKKNEN